MIRLTTLTGIIAVLTILAVALRSSTIAQSIPNKADSETLPDGPGKEVVIEKCLPCHNVRVTTARRGSGSADEWEQVVNKMVSQGAELSDDDIDLVVQYLAANYGPNSKNSHSASQGAEAEHSSSDTTATSDAGTHPVPSDSTGPVNVNKANAEALESALGLAKTEAEAIVQYREKHGDFKNWQEVSSIPGVPPEKIKNNQKRLVF